MSRTLVLLGLGLVVAVAVWLTLGAPRTDGPQLAPVSGAAGAEPAAPAASGADAATANATVVRVVDGDTVHLAFGSTVETVRLLGIDTPETVDERKPVQCFGPEASARTKALLAPGTPVHVERDTEARDQYGRLLAYVWRAADGLFVNRSLVADGYAVVLVIEPNHAHAADLRAVEATARQGGLGLWGTCGGPGRAAAPSTTRAA